MIVMRAITVSDNGGMRYLPPRTYIMEYDIEAHDGRGEVVWTAHLDKARRWMDRESAMRDWKAQSKVRPLRPDGKPNRPLTAFTVSLESVP